MSDSLNHIPILYNGRSDDVMGRIDDGHLKVEPGRAIPEHYLPDGLVYEVLETVEENGVTKILEARIHGLAVGPITNAQSDD